jgi:hypothetical protein
MKRRKMSDDTEGYTRSDLRMLVCTDETPLWDGKSTIHLREATAAQHAEWEQPKQSATMKFYPSGVVVKNITIATLR